MKVVLWNAMLALILPKDDGNGRFYPAAKRIGLGKSRVGLLFFLGRLSPLCDLPTSETSLISRECRKFRSDFISLAGQT